MVLLNASRLLRCERDTIIDAIMAYRITIDGAGRLVIPKQLRDRFGLEAGTRLHVEVREGGIHLSPDRPDPALIERDGFLVLDLGSTDLSQADHRDERERRTHAFIDSTTRA